MGRVLSLARHFGIPALISVNKWDINPALAGEIERQAALAGAAIAARVRYDPSVTGAQIAALTVVERGGPASEDIRSLWKAIKEQMQHGRVPV